MCCLHVSYKEQLQAANDAQHAAEVAAQEAQHQASIMQQKLELKEVQISEWKALEQERQLSMKETAKHLQEVSQVMLQFPQAQATPEKARGFTCS